jgi:hypothetical protein
VNANANTKPASNVNTAKPETKPSVAANTNVKK